MQDIADALGISLVTVWKVMNNRAGVSDSLKGRIIAKAAELGYTHSAAVTLSSHDYEEKSSVSLIVSRPESSLFWTGMIHRIAKEFTHRNINLVYTYVPSFYRIGYQLPAILNPQSVQGIIIMNVYDEAMLRLINTLPIPKVFLDTVTSIPSYELAGDLVLLEGRNSIREITDHIISQGRTNLGFIGDIRYARTNYERYIGFEESLSAHKIPIRAENCMTQGLGIYDYYEKISCFLGRIQKMPDAFVCASDYVAHFLLYYLNGQGYKVPQHVAVSGYDGNSEYGISEDILTTVPVNTDALGKLLVRELLFRMENPESPYEVDYVNVHVRYGSSTCIRPDSDVL